MDGETSEGGVPEIGGIRHREVTHRGQERGRLAQRRMATAGLSLFTVGTPCNPLNPQQPWEDRDAWPACEVQSGECGHLGWT